MTYQCGCPVCQSETPIRLSCKCGNPKLVYAQRDEYIPRIRNGMTVVVCLSCNTEGGHGNTKGAAKDAWEIKYRGLD